MSKVDDLIALGFQQVSRKYRLLARIPAGKTGLQALAEVQPDYARQILDNAERQAAAAYMRIHACGDDRVELTREEFEEYLSKTGRAPVL